MLPVTPQAHSLEASPKCPGKHVHPSHKMWPDSGFGKRQSCGEAFVHFVFMCTHPIRRIVLFLLSLIAACALSTAENLKPLHRLDFQNELCPAESQQLNYPKAGVDFISEDELLVYTLCRVNVALSVRDVFRPTDPNHLKAIILNLSSGAVRQRFDWPTHGHGSQVRVTHSGQLLVQRDNVLEPITPEGKPIKAMRIVKLGLYDIVLTNVSPAVDAVTVTEISGSPGGGAVNGVIVLDSRDNLSPLGEWHDDQADGWNFAASASTAVQTAGWGSELQVRKLDSKEWKTVLSGAPRAIFHPLFVSDSEFAVPANGAAFLFVGSGGQTARLGCSNAAVKVAVSRQGNVLGSLCIHEPLDTRDYSVQGFYQYIAGTAYIDVSRIPGLIARHLGWVDLPPAAESSIDLAISPAGSKVAVVDGLKVFVFEVPAN